MENQNIIKNVDVAVIGGGVSGLSAAYRLFKAGRDVTVIEARDRVGGRTWTRETGGMKIDVGGQWIGPAQTEVMQFCKEHNLETVATYTTGRKLMDLYGKVRTYKGLIPKVSPWSLLVFGWALLRIELVLRKFPKGNPWLAKKAKKWDSMTVADWQRRNMPSRVARDLMTAAFKTIFGCDTADLSLLHVLSYAKSSGGFIPLIDAESEAGSQHLRLVDGAMSISTKMAEILGNDNVLYNSPVTEIRQEGEEVHVVCKTGVVVARKVIIATPLSIAAKMRFFPALPANKRQLLTRTPMADIVKVFLFYKEAFWRQDGKSGEAVATKGPFSVVFDNVSPTGVPCLLAFVGGDDARAWSEKSPKERRSLAIKTMARYFGEQALQPVEYHEQNWAEQEYSGGGPVGFFPTNTLSTLGSTMRVPNGHIHWAGTETAKEFCGFIEGAKRAGYRAADEVAVVLPAKHKVGTASK